MFFNRLFNRGAHPSSPAAPTSAPSSAPTSAPTSAPAPAELRKPGNPVIAFVLFRDAGPTAAELLSEISRATLHGQTPGDLKDDNGVITFKLGDDTAGIVVIPKPYPASDLDAAIRETWMLGKTADRGAIQAHRSHAIVTLTGGTASPVERRLAATQLTALLAKRDDVLAVIWGDAHLLVFPPAFVAMAGKLKSPKMPPLLLWVNLRSGPNPDGTYHIVTRGLEGLGHHDIEIPATRRSPGELRDWLPNIILYLLEKGPVLQQGQTIGPDAKTQYKITHGPSSFGLPGTFISLAE